MRMHAHACRNAYACANAAHSCIGPAPSPPLTPLSHSLTPLEATAQSHNRPLPSLPVAAVLLWGVIALEMEQQAAARDLLGRYIAAGSVSSGECAQA